MNITGTFHYPAKFIPQVEVGFRGAGPPSPEDDGGDGVPRPACWSRTSTPRRGRVGWPTGTVAIPIRSRRMSHPSLGPPCQQDMTVLIRTPRATCTPCSRGGRENEVALGQSEAPTRSAKLPGPRASGRRRSYPPVAGRALRRSKLAAEGHQSVHLAGDGRGRFLGLGSGQRAVGSEDLPWLGYEVTDLKFAIDPVSATTGRSTEDHPRTGTQDLGRGVARLDPVVARSE